jgi:hypothetical protein
MTHSSQPTSSAGQKCPSYVPPWQQNNPHQGDYGGSQMFPPSQFPEQRLPSRCGPRVPP